MKHDLAHEERQNEALRMLARAIGGLAAESGKSGYKQLVGHVEEILKADEAEAPAEVVLPIEVSLSPDLEQRLKGIEDELRAVEDAEKARHLDLFHDTADIKPE